MVFRRKDLAEILPFNWRCEACGNLMPSASDIYHEAPIYRSFEDYIDLDYLDKHPILSTDPDCYKAIRTISGTETTGLIAKIQGQCTNPRCRCELTLKLWMELGLEKKDGSLALLKISHTELVEGDGVIIDANPGFYRGVDIACGLNTLYLRWWLLGGEIFIICPFIGKSELEYFDSIGLQITETHNSILVGKSAHNPFKKIITRRFTQHNFKRAEISSLIHSYLREIDENMVFIDGYPGSGIEFVFSGNLFEVENIPRKDFPGEDNEPQRFANYFHGKMYGACFNGMAEVVITSYNYTIVESLQLESMAFIRTSEDNFRRQIEIFENDQHMTIRPVEFH